jgi:predicted dehydrogenase
MAGLNSRLHVFCEKPPGRSVQDIKNVIKVEARYPKLKLMYGFNYRHHYSVKDALAVMFYESDNEWNDKHKSG